MTDYPERLGHAWTGSERQLRFVEVLNDDDMFRMVIRTFALIEDELASHITEMLVEPIDRLESTPFHHKLNLAVGLGIIPPEARVAFEGLATLRNQLAHGRRDPEDVTVDEALGLLHAIAPNSQFGTDTGGLRETVKSQNPEPIIVVKWAINLAYAAAETGGRLARRNRYRAREALRREIAAEQKSALARAAAGIAADIAAETDAEAST